MKKVVKKRNSKQSLTSKYKVVFFAIVVLYLVSATLLKNYNVNLKQNLYKIENENTELKSTNQTLKIKIDELSSFERMSNIAQKNGLKNREGTIKNVK
ncbi:cell division protein FtsL [Bacilli bacterium PM5-3]|nr:cell division protein FtsL [Bacilli bacterium PM5-3]MDH6603236.1 cell division protein FtsL [Bacilli bacterium PM5-9]